MGYLYDHYCHETLSEAQACVYGHPDPIVVNQIIYYSSFENGTWVLKSNNNPPQTLSLPVINFPTCDIVGPIHKGEQISFSSDFWIPLFWAIGISAAFMLFKKAL